MSANKHNMKGGVEFMSPPEGGVPAIDKGTTGDSYEMEEMGLPMNIISDRTGLTKEQVLGEQDPEEKEEPQKKETSKAAHYNTAKHEGVSTWNNEPSVQGQMDIEGAVKAGPLQFALFDLSDTTQQNSYNELLKREFPDEAPQVMIEERTTQFHEGKFMALVHYREILYKKL